MTAPSVKPRTAEVVIYQGDDLATIADLRTKVRKAEAEAGGPSRVGDSASVKAAATQYDEFVSEAAERAVVVTLQALPRRRWRALRDEHPPRPDNEGDEALGFNEDALADVLVPESIVAPEWPSVADRDAFLDSLSDADWQRLFSMAYGLNTVPEGDPKGLSLVSVLDQMSGETSSSPGRLA